MRTLRSPPFPRVTGWTSASSVEPRRHRPLIGKPDFVFPGQALSENPVAPRGVIRRMSAVRRKCCHGGGFAVAGGTAAIFWIFPQTFRPAERPNIVRTCGGVRRGKDAETLRRGRNGLRMSDVTFQGRRERRRYINASRYDRDETASHYYSNRWGTSASNLDEGGECNIGPGLGGVLHGFREEHKTQSVQDKTLARRLVGIPCYRCNIGEKMRRIERAAEHFDWEAPRWQARARHIVTQSV